MKTRFSALFMLLFTPAIFAAELNLPDGPLFVDGSKTALVQIVMERDNKLFFEAYPTYEDINNDGVLDIKYKPHEIDYYGYFDSHFCYIVVGSDHMEPVSKTADKKCGNAWSGDFLNYTTMTRMDVMLRALYGGKRIIDSTNETRLRRAFVPWENHTWGIEYTSVAEDGFDITDFTPLAMPQRAKRHLFSTNNIYKNDVPFLRVRTNTDDHIWDWVDKERSQGDGYANLEMPLDVTVCASNFLEESCQQYPNGRYKPVGLLHEYGENNSMYFSLISGSYENNLQGGVLRQKMGSFGEKEVDPATGVFTRAPGIVTSLDAIQIPNDFKSGTVQRDCGWLYDRTFKNGECKAWGNPVAEMMYEGMRYLAGEMSPTPEFDTDGGMDAALGLSSTTWDDPYSPSQPYAQCSSAYQLLVSDPSPSFDGDQLPGSDFANFNSSSLGDLHVGELADFISSNESAIPGLKFIGQVGNNADGSPSPKLVNSFRNIRGQAPQAPHREGSYYAPSVAYYGHQNDLHSSAPGKQTVGNFTLALGSPLPSIDVEVAGSTVSFAPFAKTVEFCGKRSNYVPTNAIVGFTVENITDTTGSFRVSFEDMEQGADNDMDAVARYTYSVSGNTVTMTVDSILASGCAIQHLGYTVSGTTQDGVHLVVRDKDTKEDKDKDYKLDVPPNAIPGTGWSDGVALPLISTINFTPSAAPAAQALPSPLWYAAKWGGFDDQNNDGIPQKAEWDANDDGLPDNYFPVTDPSRMVQTMRSVFNQISKQAGAASSVVASAGSLKLGNKIYRSTFTGGDWTGDVLSQTISETGEVSAVADWSAKDALQAQLLTSTRQILTYNPDSRQGVPFRWPANTGGVAAEEISTLQQAALNRNPLSNNNDNKGPDRLEYLRGVPKAGFRVRDAALGDIIRSSPILVDAPNYHYSDDWGTGEPESSMPYSSFRAAHKDRQRVVYVGANDGMLHAIDAGTITDGKYNDGSGRELFAYVPSPVYPQLPDLTDPKYGHKFFVDATPRASDVFINGQWRTVLVGGLGRGGQGIYALDVTNPHSITEDTASSAVMWEFTDREDQGLGFTFQTPVVARMANGKWNAIVANGYNNSANNVGYKKGGGWSSIMIIDIETGSLVRKLFPKNKSCQGNPTTPNAMAEPTAVDLDGDKIVDTIYAGDLNGCVYRFDVSSSNPNGWAGGELKHKAVDDAGKSIPITTAIAVGSHPTGSGVLLYFGAGKYLEPSDQMPASTARRIYSIWDRGAGDNTVQKTKVSKGNLLEQYITSETIRSFDTDNDGVDDSSLPVRETSQEPIDWDTHEGWYMNLHFNAYKGEQVVASPVLRGGKILFTTHIPVGNECTPGQQGWLMVFDARSGAMLDESPLDFNGDGKRNDGNAAGVGNLVNPFAPPTLLAAEGIDYLLSQDDSGAEVTSTGLSINMNDGRLTWREMEP